LAGSLPECVRPWNWEEGGTATSWVQDAGVSSVWILILQNLRKTIYFWQKNQTVLFSLRTKSISKGKIYFNVLLDSNSTLYVHV
jgi:hypothetical protein